MGNEVVVTLGPVTIVIDSETGGDVAPALSLTVTLNEEAPVALAVPLITPVEAFNEKPEGNDPLLTVQLL